MDDVERTSSRRFFGGESSAAEASESKSKDAPSVGSDTENVGVPFMTSCISQASRSAVAFGVKDPYTIVTFVVVGRRSFVSLVVVELPKYLEEEFRRCRGGAAAPLKLGLCVHAAADTDTLIAAVFRRV